MFILVRVIFVFLFTVVYSQTDQIYVQNLDERCLRCLCYAASNCDYSLGCNNGYCGPYKISQDYWADAGKVVMPYDDEERVPGAFEDCALHLSCAQMLIRNYMAKYGRDCNGDGVTDCDDFSMINFNGGGIQCVSNLTRSLKGRNWIRRYSYCSPSL